ncbi:unnamed protein product [Orchesella dallaii]|uniref:Alpha-ketoglutarate-dependent dioxygenase alkB 4 n=1 Tax=Orchesella dallaii TaxID=48710 RepID=A0ABP1RAX3_9HEXA
MFKPRPCGCKGIRTCLVCEADFGIAKVNPDLDEKSSQESFEFCHLCGDLAWKGQDVWKDHPHLSASAGESFPFLGVYLEPNFMTEEEERRLVAGCDSMEWDLSQSGRRKQNFGPKTNFKKKKISGRSFQGFPPFSKEFQEKLNSVPLLSDFITIEQCAIEYRPETGACIDPHIDDCWVWGERVISINLLSDSVLTMNKFTGGITKYNLSYCYNDSIREDPIQKEEAGGDKTGMEHPLVRIPMPRRSLLVLYGPARYQWEHGIFRKDITGRRICMAYREFTPEYLPKGQKYDDVGKEIIERANQIVDNM